LKLEIRSKVCAGRATAVVMQNARIAHVARTGLSFCMVTSPQNNAPRESLLCASQAVKMKEFAGLL
jgi:hypothetical protein